MNTQTKIKIGVVAGALLAFACMQSVRAEDRCDASMEFAAVAVNARTHGVTKQDVNAIYKYSKLSPQERSVRERIANRVYELNETQLMNAGVIDVMLMGKQICDYTLGG